MRKFPLVAGVSLILFYFAAFPSVALELEADTLLTRIVDTGQGSVHGHRAPGTGRSITAF